MAASCGMPCACAGLWPGPGRAALVVRCLTRHCLRHPTTAGRGRAHRFSRDMSFSLYLPWPWEGRPDAGGACVLRMQLGVVGAGTALAASAKGCRARNRPWGPLPHAPMHPMHPSGARGMLHSVYFCPGALAAM
ncbi:hypothetical protein BS50DRAFT_144818 [Corynespora cassiicola Philippines]|uniref:Uncharacterized protein n=1 Tax=Corynespora cassiicola Philippines TaxID=1448308 RepID=A0A2T2N8H2_CORCC|nr:hypothetical protein BS50DRAFT_144818 [Corynespora cassiicola Philippines]